MSDMRTPEHERRAAIDQMNELRDRSYAQVTRGWWWRGFLSGATLGFLLGSALIYLVAWLTGNL